MASNTSSAAECTRLAEFKSLGFEEIMALGCKYYAEDISLWETMVSSTLNDTTVASVNEKLAEVLYYRQGALLLKENRVADLTPRQQEHEMLVRGLVTRKELPTASMFRLQLQLRVEVMREMREQGSQREESPDSGYKSHNISPNTAVDDEVDNSDEPTEDEEDEEDYPEKKAIYVKVWKPELGRYVTFRY